MRQIFVLPYHILSASGDALSPIIDRPNLTFWGCLVASPIVFAGPQQNVCIHHAVTHVWLLDGQLQLGVQESKG
jgi:hypothetical protein